ncbi:T9SS type A sorting domain-containing protein [uncultured Bacteroides sp.]|uniref:T9SS type A sorting domain-containing protein n=1 Tax=uncultured Bacteroides sp. TaxID=162156 RepID=UPI002AAAAC5F|nr:T9SS type A sorting domain-containing protein [uncultured Bacteroides sp.]
MKKLLLGAVTLMLGAASMNAQSVKDPAVYTAVNGYGLKNLWIQSEKTNSNTELLTRLGANARGMAVLNGEVLFCKRLGDPNVSSIDVYDGATGAFKRNVQLAANVFLQNDGTAVGIPCNDIQVDAAGHVLVCNLETNAAKESFQVWSINMADGSGTKVLDCLLPDVVTANGLRFDAFGVYGDVTGDGYLMAAAAGDEAGVGNQVLRWDIKGGVVDGSNPTFITISSYYPAAAITNGTAPRVCPVDNDLFYLDGFNSAATLYGMDGVMVDSFTAAPDCTPYNVGNNGVDEFTINGKNFVAYVYSNTVGVPPQAWNLCELGAGQSFTGMQKYFQFPEAGMGAASNAVRTALPRIEVNAAKTVATIYVYAKGAGVAAYQFGLASDIGTGIKETTADAALKVVATANGIELSEAANVEVFNFAGQKVAAKANASKVTLAPGMYIVKAVTAEGAVATAKVNVK